MTVARILIWNLYDSKTSLDELREHLTELPGGSHWISHGDERFGLIALGDELPDLGEVPRLIGIEPAIGEEFEVE